MRCRRFCREQTLNFTPSRRDRRGVRELVRSIADALDKIPKPAAETVLDLAHGSNRMPMRMDIATAAQHQVGRSVDDTSPAAAKNL